MKLCVICKKNETGRLMDRGWGEKLPVCGECLVSGRWRELLPAPVEPEPQAPEEPAPEAGQSGAEAVAPPAEDQAPDVGVPIGDYLCPKCKVTHRTGSKVHKRHLKLL